LDLRKKRDYDDEMRNPLKCKVREMRERPGKKVGEIGGEGVKYFGYIYRVYIIPVTEHVNERYGLNRDGK
jgi:hypothetical protein